MKKKDLKIQVRKLKQKVWELENPGLATKKESSLEEVDVSISFTYEGTGLSIHVSIYDRDFGHALHRTMYEVRARKDKLDPFRYIRSRLEEEKVFYQETTHMDGSRNADGTLKTWKTGQWRMDNS